MQRVRVVIIKFPDVIKYLVSFQVSVPPSQFSFSQFVGSVQHPKESHHQDHVSLKSFRMHTLPSFLSFPPSDK